MVQHFGKKQNNHLNQLNCLFPSHIGLSLGFNQFWGNHNQCFTKIEGVLRKESSFTRLLLICMPPICMPPMCMPLCVCPYMYAPYMYAPICMPPIYMPPICMPLYVCPLYACHLYVCISLGRIYLQTRRCTFSCSSSVWTRLWMGSLNLSCLVRGQMKANRCFSYTHGNGDSGA